MDYIENPIRGIVNFETGEVENQLFEGDKYRVIRKEQVDYIQKNANNLEKERIYDFGQDKNFSLLSEYSAKQLADEKLTATEYRVLLVMISNTHYKSGLVAFANNQPLTKEWLVKNLSITRKTIDSSIKTLIDKGIIAQNTTNYKTKYFFNPYIQYRGKWINRTLYEIFKNTKWAKLSKR